MVFNKEEITNLPKYARRAFYQFSLKVLAGIATGLVPIITTTTLAAIARRWFSPTDNDCINADIDTPPCDFMGAVVIAPIVEEIIYRGVVLNSFKFTIRSALNMMPINTPNVSDNKTPKQIDEEQIEKLISYSSFFGSALMFSLRHEPLTMIPAFTAGMQYAILNEQFFDGSLIPSISAHATNNALAYAAYCVAS